MLKLVKSSNYLKRLGPLIVTPQSSFQPKLKNKINLPHANKIVYKLPVLNTIELKLPVFNAITRPILDCGLLQSKVLYKLPAIVPASPIRISYRCMNIMRIRRRKMKKHKVRKHLKRMKFIRMRRIQKKELLRERAFQATLVAKVKEAQNFNADEYVNSRIEKLLELRALSSAIPRTTSK